MEVKYVPISEIKPYKKNPRKNEGAVRSVAESIKQYGWNQPIVVDKDNVIIVGHTRLKAAKKLGMKEVPVYVASNLTDEQVKKYRILDNKTNELSDWDFQLLKEEIEEFQLDFSEFDVDFNAEFTTAFTQPPEGGEVNDPDFNDAAEGEEEGATSPEEEWTDMPEFSHNKDEEGVKHIVVHFARWDDVTAFANLIKQRITEKTTYVWFPPKETKSRSEFLYE